MLRFETTTWPPIPEETFLDANSLAELRRGYGDTSQLRTAKGIGMILSTHISGLLWSAYGDQLDGELGARFHEVLSAQADEVGGPIADNFKLYLELHLSVKRTPEVEHV